MPLSPVLTAVGVGGVGSDAAELGVAPLRQPVSAVVATAARMRIRTVRMAVASSRIGYHPASAHAAPLESVRVLNIGQVVLTRWRDRASGAVGGWRWAARAVTASTCRFVATLAGRWSARRRDPGRGRVRCRRLGFVRRAG